MADAGSAGPGREEPCPPDERRIATILDNISDAFYTLDREWRFTFINREAERLIMRPREQLLGKSVWEEFPYLRGMKLEDEYRRAVREQRKVEFEDYFPPIGRWVSVHAYPSEEGLSVYSHDVTERHRAEEALRASESRYRALFDHNLDAVLLADREGHIYAANPAATRLFGYSEEELRRLGRQGITDPTDPRLERWLEERERSGTLRGELTMVRADGSRFPAEVSSVLYTDEAGTEWSSVMIRDISESKRAEEVQHFLAESGRALVSILDYEEALKTLAHLVVPERADCCFIDVLGRGGDLRRAAVVYRDPELEEKLRHSQCFFALPGGAAGVQHAFDTGQPQLISEVTDPWLQTVSPDPECLALARELRPRSIMILPLIARGQRLGVLTMATTTSGRSYDQTDLAIATDLARRAALAVDNARLYQESLQASRLRDDVLAAVSHDLRNPLHTISLSVGLLLEFLPPDGGEFEKMARHQLEIILRSTDRANRLIQDLLDVATIEEGRFAVNTRAEATLALVKEAVELHRALADEHSLTLVDELPESLPPILADHDRLLQVFSNLIGNAIKFTPEGGRITVRAGVEDGVVRFSVADTGPGIRKEDFPVLFAPFWQAVKGAKGGVGLGLPIAKGIVEAHGGRIWAESTLGQGSTFYFTIPVAARRKGDEH
jgi:PAS domain S-box-containing protein